LNFKGPKSSQSPGAHSLLLTLSSDPEAHKRIDEPAHIGKIVLKMT